MFDAQKVLRGNGRAGSSDLARGTADRNMMCNGRSETGDSRDQHGRRGARGSLGMMGGDDGRRR
jgi:hypothetical protein